MRRDYKYLYQRAPIPFVRLTAGYTDPVRTDEERRVAASRLAKQQAELRRAKIAERWIVFTAASMLAIAMLPVLVAVGAIILVRALWRRCTQGWERQRTQRRMSNGVSCRRGSSDFGATTMSDLPNLSNGDFCAA